MPDASTAQLSFSGDFSASFAELLDEDTCHEIFRNHGPPGGGLPKLSGWQWLMGKVFHVMAGTGDFADQVKQITGIPISNSALSQRGASLGWELVATALRSVLRPLADFRQHPEAFHQGLRLLAIDGTRFDLRNTPAMKARAVKNRCWRGDGEPAFAHLCSVILVELYALRWEHELFYRELKSHLHGCGSLMNAQTPESAAQEALALMMAASLIARQRAAVAAQAGVEMRRVSFAKVLDATVALCRVLEIGSDLIEEQAREEWVRRVLEELATTALIPKRRPRSCSRGLRQPVQNWPKIKNPTSKPLVKTLILTNP